MGERNDNYIYLLTKFACIIPSLLGITVGVMVDIAAQIQFKSHTIIKSL